MEFKTLEEELVAQGYRRVGTFLNGDLLNCLNTHFPNLDTKEYRILPLYLALREGEKESPGKIDYLLHGVYVKE